MKKSIVKNIKNYESISCRIRPTKNFLDVINRGSKHLSVKSEFDHTHHILQQGYARHSCLDSNTVDIQLAKRKT